jgi:hypothetical protein
MKHHLNRQDATEHKYVEDELEIRVARRDCNEEN